jgi:tRNA (guanine-N7-)-methyltransferase
MTRSLSEQETDPGDAPGRRRVRSFVLRAGRLTEGQKRALEHLWPVYGLAEWTDQLDLDALFGNSNPVIMEIGFGNGDATWQMAAAHPEENYLAVEVHRPGVGHLLLKLEEHGISNVRIACEDAVELLHNAIPAASLAGVRIYFPDPWPKKRHHKRRIIQPSFIRLMAEKMRMGGILHMATDWQPYAEYMREVMRTSPDFDNFSQGEGPVPRPAWRPETKYEKRGERLGHGVFDLIYRRNSADLDHRAC